jgi:tRNA dimethylallyltransferase
MKLNDPVFFSKGEMQNPQRMLRALEVKLSTDKSIFDFHSAKKTKRKFDIKVRLLELPREQLYQNINLRVDEMMNHGLLKEVENLYPFKHLNALQTVGYKELFDYLDGKISLEKAIEKIKKNTRHYAKRQMTWFRKIMENKN